NVIYHTKTTAIFRSKEYDPLRLCVTCKNRPFYRPADQFYFACYLSRNYYNCRCSKGVLWVKHFKKDNAVEELVDCCIYVMMKEEQFVFRELCDDFYENFDNVKCNYISNYTAYTAWKALDLGLSFDEHFQQL